MTDIPTPGNATKSRCASSSTGNGKTAGTGREIENAMHGHGTRTPQLTAFGALPVSMNA